MAASAGHAVAYTIGQIFKDIIDCVQLYFTNGFMNIVFHLKRWFFFAKIGIFSKSIAGPRLNVVQAYTQPYSFYGRVELIICQIRYELSAAWKKTLDGWS